MTDAERLLSLWRDYSKKEREKRRSFALKTLLGVSSVLVVLAGLASLTYVQYRIDAKRQQEWTQAKVLEKIRDTHLIQQRLQKQGGGRQAPPAQGRGIDFV